MRSSMFINGPYALLSMAQMPAGIPVGTLMLGSKHPEYREAIQKYRTVQAEKVLESATLPNASVHAHYHQGAQMLMRAIRAVLLIYAA